MSKVPDSMLMALSSGLKFDALDKTLSSGDVLGETDVGHIYNDTDREQVTLVLYTKDKRSYKQDSHKEVPDFTSLNYFEPVINQYVDRVH